MLCNMKNLQLLVPKVRPGWGKYSLNVCINFLSFVNSLRFGIDILYLSFSVIKKT